MSDFLFDRPGPYIFSQIVITIKVLLDYVVSISASILFRGNERSTNSISE